MTNSTWAETTGTFNHTYSREGSIRSLKDRRRLSHVVKRCVEIEKISRAIERIEVARSVCEREAFILSFTQALLAGAGAVGGLFFICNNKRASIDGLKNCIDCVVRYRDELVELRKDVLPLLISLSIKIPNMEVASGLQSQFIARLATVDAGLKIQNDWIESSMKVFNEFVAKEDVNGCQDLSEALQNIRVPMMTLQKINLELRSIRNDCNESVGIYAAM